MHQKIVALFADRTSAERARDELASAGLGLGAARLSEARDDSATERRDSGSMFQEQSAPGGFLDWLFGEDVPDADADRYRTHVGERGRTLLVVEADAAEGVFERAVAILERHDPIDIDEENEGRSGTTATAGTAATGAVGMTGATGAAAPRRDAAAGDRETVIPTAREELAVGKREVEGARRYRVRSYVVERPVEVPVTLREESVSIERRAPGSGRPLGEGAFEEREIEVTEHREVPVAEKRVTRGEDVVVRRDVRERKETVRDTVRETKVDIDKAAAGDKPSAATPVKGGPATRTATGAGTGPAAGGTTDAGPLPEEPGTPGPRKNPLI